MRQHHIVERCLCDWETWMFCSTIIPTIGRETLAVAVSSVLTQEGVFGDSEVIVVNDSGRSLPSAEWQQSPKVRILDTCRRERCVARNSGAAIARGKYLHFLDDDDILLPGALSALWQLSEQNQDATWLYGSYQTVDNNGALVSIWHPRLTGHIFPQLVAGESIPFQASLLLSSHFFAVGMFDPHPAILGVEDRDVGRRMAFSGRVAYQPSVVAQIRIGEQNSTTNWSTIAESDRWGREKALRLEGATTQLRRSAKSAYWRGRVFQAILASARWNLSRRAGFTAASRVVAALPFAGNAAFSRDFWSGVMRRDTNIYHA
ncbi:MAG: glycosyltransferase family A protein [Caldilinea sp.]